MRELISKGPRRVELERKLAADTTSSDDRKARQLAQLGRKESAFLRLRRTKLGLDDFRTVKVIGKGAFGEVSSISIATLLSHIDQFDFHRCDWFKRPILARSMP